MKWTVVFINSRLSKIRTEYFETKREAAALIAGRRNINRVGRVYFIMEQGR